MIGGVVRSAGIWGLVDPLDVYKHFCVLCTFLHVPISLQLKQKEKGKKEGKPHVLQGPSLEQREHIPKSTVPELLVDVSASTLWQRGQLL